MLFNAARNRETSIFADRCDFSIGHDDVSQIEKQDGGSIRRDIQQARTPKEMLSVAIQVLALI